MHIYLSSTWKGGGSVDLHKILLDAGHTCTCSEDAVNLDADENVTFIQNAVHTCDMAILVFDTPNHSYIGSHEILAAFAFGRNKPVHIIWDMPEGERYLATRYTHGHPCVTSHDSYSDFVAYFEKKHPKNADTLAKLHMHYE